MTLNTIPRCSAPFTVLRGVLLPIVVAALIPASAHAAAGEGCPNEQMRMESNVNPTTGQPYSLGLPECRAYEMVSPLDKQAHSAKPYGSSGYPVAPGGEGVGWISEGDFSHPDGYRVNFSPSNPYTSTRTPSGWTTASVFAPAGLIATTFENGLVGSDFSPDLTTVQLSCGLRGPVDNEGAGAGFTCAYRDPEGAWTSAATYYATSGEEPTGFGTEGYLGSSIDLSRVFIQPEVTLLPADTVHSGGSTGIYEIADPLSPDPQLRLVNVTDSGEELTSGLGGPLLGDSRQAPSVEGTAYHAISESGETVFFTATPSLGVQTVYARLHATETIAVSDPSPSQCTRTTPACGPAASATFQGASASGEKVFFTTVQQLTNADTDTTADLYEYDFAAPPGHNILQLSAGGAGDPTPGAGAEVQGVVGTSPAGARVYFVARGVLTTTANGLGQSAVSHADNLYGVDTETGETKFVAELCSGAGVSGATADAACPTAMSDSAVWEDETANRRPAQLTPNGRYLVFDTSAHLAPEDVNDAQAVYRYDFQTGELTWVSHAATGFASGNEGRNATIAATPVKGDGSELDVEDWDRAISEDGQDIVFSTAERLQADDDNGGSGPSSCEMTKFTVSEETAGCDVYEWHNGVVSMISDGRDPKGSGAPVISASGRDIFFFTHTQLVGQDTDALQDLYDARIDGGFPAPTPESSCAGEACQGAPSTAPTFSAPGTQSFTGGGNLTPGSTAFPAPAEPKPKPKRLTRAQKLAKALARCRRDKNARTRATCYARAKKRYSPKINTKHKSHKHSR